MENLIIGEDPIGKDQDFPSINFNFETGYLSMKGKSLPPNPYDFYTPIMNNLKEFLAVWEKDIYFDISMLYFNTASSKQIADLLALFIQDKSKEEKKLAYNKLFINWFYTGGDEDMAEAGTDYYELLQIQDHPKIDFKVLAAVRNRSN